MRPTDVPLLHGAVPLDPKPAAPPAGSRAPGGAVIDVTEATFVAEVLERSREVPVVVDFWAAWCGPCKQLSPVLERLAAEGNGEWVLAKVDVDANQRLAAQFQVQSIPTVYAVYDGQPVDGFMGAMPESQVREWLSGVLAAAGGAVPPAPADPAFEQAEQAMRRGDLDAAAAALRDLLTRSPGDVDAKSALARVELLRRLRGLDERSSRRRAADAPDDVAAATAVADLDVAAGRVDEALGRLVDVVRRTSGADRDAARTHLLSLFDVLDPDDPRVARARRDLTAALF